jgi:hypothetical protein
MVGKQSLRAVCRCDYSKLKSYLFYARKKTDITNHLLAEQFKSTN